MEYSILPLRNTVLFPNQIIPIYIGREQSLKLINDINIPIIDIHKKFFTKQNDPLQYFAHRIYGHYSPKGYNEISKLILKEIENLNINKQE